LTNYCHPNGLLPGKKIFRTFIALGISLVFFIGVLPSAAVGATEPATSPSVTEISAPKPEKKEPIYITSDKMEAYNKKNMIIFIGTVSAIQGKMEIQSDRLEVFMKKKEKSAAGGAGAASGDKKNPSADGPDQSSVDRLIAIGNVLITQEKSKYASGEHLDYRETSGIAVLTGNPRAWDNKNQVIGTKIEIFLKDGRTIVYGSKSRRVSVTLYPGNDKPGSNSNSSATGFNGK
jgi:lipopolysaccharide transport protein LptA